MSTVSRHNLGPGMFLTVVECRKFKTGVLSASILRPLLAREATLHALLPRVLRRGNNALPNLGRFAAALEDAYGAQLEPYVRKKGEVHAAGFVCDFVEGRFLQDNPPVLETVARILCQTLLNPVLSDGLFLADYVKTEKENLLAAIRAEKNDKRAYAEHRMLAAMCKNEPFGVGRSGSEEELAKITPRTLWNYYRRVVPTSVVELVYVGCSSPHEVKQALEPHLADMPRTGLTPLKNKSVHTVETLNRVTEVLDVNQGKLSMGMRMGVTLRDEAYPAALLAATIFGGSTTSKLFTHVREELSLAYYASAHLYGAKGLLVVNSGIDPADKDQAEQEILKQWNTIAAGDISDEELQQGRRSLVNNLLVTTDSPHAMEDYYLGQAASGNLSLLEDLAAKISHVSKEQVIKAAAAGVWDTLYFLKGAER